MCLVWIRGRYSRAGRGFKRIDVGGVADTVACGQIVNVEARRVIQNVASDDGEK
jgi:hypothetical protein